MLCIGLMVATLTLGTGVDVSVTLQDGSNVDGVVELSAFEMDTIFGQVVVPLSEVSFVRFGPRDLILTEDGTVLQGEIRLDALVVVQGEERRSLARERLSTLVVKPPRAASGTRGAATTPAQVRVTTVDGAGIDGTLMLSAVKMRTGFGLVLLDLERLATLEFGNPDVAKTVRGETYEGRVLLNTVPVRTEAGVMRIPRNRIKTIAFTRPS